MHLKDTVLNKRRQIHMATLYDSVQMKRSEKASTETEGRPRAARWWGERRIRSLMNTRSLLGVMKKF